MYQEQIHIAQEQLKEVLQKAASRIAPLWSLENFVAVNPYLGMTDTPFERTMEFLHQSSQSEATLPIRFYLEAIRRGKIKEEDITESLRHQDFGLDEDIKTFIQRAHLVEGKGEEGRIKTLSDVASEINGKKWRRFMVDRISSWASAYFDGHQAIWDTANQEASLFAAWKREAEVDLSPETMGMKGFRKWLRQVPNEPLEAAQLAIATLGVPDNILAHYLNGVLMKMNGWAGIAARMDWDAGLEGKNSQAVQEFLAILLVWELSFRELLKYPDMDLAWEQAKVEAELIVRDAAIDERLARQLVLQEAFDRANQRSIIQQINEQEGPLFQKRKPKVQAIFCIDVRSELFRRNLEAASEDIETMGFAGFFGFPIKYVPLAHSEGSNQCPVLLTTSHTIKEQLTDVEEENAAIRERTLKEHVLKAWKSFKLGAISCFGFVSPLGIFYLPKLLLDAFGIARPLPHPEHAGLSPENAKKKRVKLHPEHHALETTGIPVADRLQLATSALKAMSLTDDFARIVLITGHGSSTTNNPHGTGLDCGACGGHTGEANAKVAAAVLNDPKVRAGLKEAGIDVPASTFFLPALHDTTTDEVTLLYANKEVPATHHRDLADLKYALKMAGHTARIERGSRMKLKHGDISRQVVQRSSDWSQVRPEWGLAGCSSFIVAPRERTEELNFGGKAFMHSYVWQKDTDFNVLELIMTAPMVVTSWINLQYYASTVDNKKFGAGNKTLHNVVGGLGVLEGFAGDLRVGLPWQSVHDGEEFQHEPQRLNVIIEAPVDEMSKILAKHEGIRNLCDNRWIYLFAINNEGKVAYRYTGNLEWELL